MKRTPGKTAEQRAEHWTKIIEEARRYPAGITAFCNDRGVNKNNYYQWFKKLRPFHPEWTDLAEDTAHRSMRTHAARRSRLRRQTQVAAKPQRRRFTADYKQEILREYDHAHPGKRAAILRREGLYSSHIQTWRSEAKHKAISVRNGAAKRDLLAVENKALKAENEKLKRHLRDANTIIQLQKKVAEILGTSFQQQPEES